MRPLIALLVAALSLAACDANRSDDLTVADLSQDPALLVGAWEWTRSVTYAWPAGNRGVQTPATSGRTEAVEFRADGTLSESVDGEVVREGPYEVRAGSVYVQGPFGLVWLGAFGVDEDDLILTTAPADGPTKYYRRVG